MRKEKGFQKLIQELEKAKAIPNIIVEGKKDKSALVQLGFNPDNIIVLHHEGRSLYTILDQIESKECAILTDFDKKGRQYYAILKKELVKKGIKINSSFRTILLRERISHIEGLVKFIQNRMKKHKLF